MFCPDQQPEYSPLEGIAKLSVRSVFGRFCRDLVFDANPHTLESRGVASNTKDRRNRPKAIDGSFAIPSLLYPVEDVSDNAPSFNLRDIDFSKKPVQPLLVGKALLLLKEQPVIDEVEELFFCFSNRIGEVLSAQLFLIGQGRKGGISEAPDIGLQFRPHIDIDGALGQVG